MPSFPSFTPTETTLTTIIDPTLSMSFDMGYESRRSRYLKPLREYTLIYKGLDRVNRNTFYEFLYTVSRLSTVSFDWTFPFSETIVGATNASPIVITVQNTHNLLTGDTAIIASVGGNTAANGTWIITRISTTQFSLNGSSGNGSYTSGGTSTQKFLKMKIKTEDDGLSSIIKYFGPDSNNNGVWEITLILRELY